MSDKKEDLQGNEDICNELAHSLNEADRVLFTQLDPYMAPDTHLRLPLSGQRLLK